MVSFILGFDYVDPNIWVGRLYEERNRSENAFWEAG